MQLSELASLLDGKLLGNDLDFQEISVYPVTHQLKPGSLALAVPVSNHETNPEFLSQLDQAAAILIDKPHTYNLPTVIVPDFSQSLAIFASAWRAKFPIPIIAVAGSSGKTTTTTLLNHILAKHYRLLPNQMAAASYNTLKGLPWVLLGLTAENNLAVIEVETLAKGEMALLAKIVQPQVVVITNIGPGFVNNLRAVDVIAKEKSALYAGLSAHGVGIINADDAFAEMFKTALGERPWVSFGIENGADVMASNIQLDAMGYPSFDLSAAEETVAVKLQLLGYHNINNALAAATAALTVGVQLEDIQQALNSFEGVEWRLTPKRAANGALVIDDSFDANPPEVLAAIKVLAHQPGEKIFVLADMVEETGKEAIQWHKKIGQAAKEAGIDRFYALGKLCKYAVEAFGQHAYHFDDTASLTAALQKDVKAGMTVLVKGPGKLNLTSLVQALISVN